MSNKNSQSGFTLIELLIVVLIIGILASIAIPVFNGQRTKAKNSVAQSTVRNAFSAASSALTNSESYKSVGYVALNAEESTLNAAAPTGTELSPGSGAADKKVVLFDGSGVAKTVTPGTGTPPGPGSDATSTNDGIIICTASKGNTSYCIKQAVTNGTPSAAQYAKLASDKEINATNVAAASFGNSWN